MKKFIISFLLIAVCNFSFCQKTNIRVYGKLVDNRTNELLSGSVECIVAGKKNLSLGTFYSNDSGKFDFELQVKQDDTLAFVYTADDITLYKDEYCHKFHNKRRFLKGDAKFVVRESVVLDTLHFCGRIDEALISYVYPNFEYKKDSIIPSLMKNFSFDDAICLNGTLIKKNQLVVEMAVNSIYNEEQSILEKRAEILLEAFRKIGVNTEQIVVVYRNEISETSGNNIVFRVIASHNSNNW